MSPRQIILAIAGGFLGLNAIMLGAYWLLKRNAGASSPRVAASASVLLTAPEGQRYVGNQLRFFNVDQDGVISTTNMAWFSLYYTEGGPFRLSGELWLGDASEPTRVADLPDGFALFIREWDSLHRYSLRTRSMEVKRRLRGGVQEGGIVQAVSFKSPVFGAWIPFSSEVSAEQISFRVGEQSGVIPGPLDIDGANKIALTPGTKLKNLRLEILEPSK